MKITYEDFILETEPIAGRLDVYRNKKKIAKENDPLVRDGRRKIGEAYIKKEEIGFGMTIEHAIERIIMEKLHDKKETTDLRGFIREFKRLKEELEIALKQ